MNVIAVRLIDEPRVSIVGLVGSLRRASIGVILPDFINVSSSTASAGGGRVRAHHRAKVVVVLSGRIVSFLIGHRRRIRKGIAIHGVGKRIRVIEKDLVPEMIANQQDRASTVYSPLRLRYRAV